MGEDVTVSDAVDASRDAGERRFRQLLDHSPDPMCVHSEGRVVYVNPAAVRGIAAGSADDVVGRMITDFVHPDSIASMLERLTALEHEGDSSPAAEAIMLRFDGSHLDVEVVSVLTSWDGKPAHQVIFRDLTMEKAAEGTLRLQAALVTHASDAIIATTTAGTITSWNRAAETIYQRPVAFALGSPISAVVGANVDPAAIVVNGGVERAIHRAADGRALTVRVSAAAMDDGYVFVCSDQTALLRAERRLQSVLNSLDEGVVVLDGDGRAEWINPAARLILGVSADDTLPPEATISGPDGTPLGDQKLFLKRILATGASLRDEVVAYDRPDGARRWLSFSARLLDSAESGQPAVLASFTDVTELYETQRRLSHQALHDSLTGLPNRANADAWVARALQADPLRLTAVMFIDLDNIKNVNDAYGHHVGDTVIKIAARRLRSTLRAEDFVARHGGDEFLALLFGHVDRDSLEQLSGRLHDAIAEPMDVAGATCSITASIGVAEGRGGRSAGRIADPARRGRGDVRGEGVPRGNALLGECRLATGPAGLQQASARPMPLRCTPTRARQRRRPEVGRGSVHRLAWTHGPVTGHRWLDLSASRPLRGGRGGDSPIRGCGEER